MLFNNQAIKLKDCKQHGLTSGAELFIVEGDSASLAVSHLRDAHFQAVLPMQGKPMNAIKASAKKVNENPLFKALTEAIGTGVGAAFDLNKCQYQRIILLMDPDADGIHSGALMLMFFYQYMQPLLVHGLIEMVRAPVGEVMNPSHTLTTYAYTDAQFIALCEAQRPLNTALHANKYRGLAGIPPETLANKCIEHSTRIGHKVGIKDAVLAIALLGGNAPLAQ